MPREPQGVQIYEYKLKVYMPKKADGTYYSDAEMEELMEEVEGYAYLLPETFQNQLRDRVNPNITVTGTESGL